MMDTLEVLKQWDLLDPNCNVARYTMSDFSKIAAAVASGYSAQPAQALNGSHLGLQLGTRIAEGGESLSRIGLPAALSDVLWLPDPAFSFLVKEASRQWHSLPESGASTFSKTPGISVGWRGLWDLPKEGRQSYARRELPRILERLRQLEPLVRAGAVRLFAWEPILGSNLADIQEICQALTADPDFAKVTTRHDQGDYNLGVRVGSFSIAAGPQNPPSGLAPGTPLWLVDKTPVALAGLMNLLVTSELGAFYVPELPGDRDVFDYIRSGGEVAPTEHLLATSLVMPRLSEALLLEIAAIRKDSESLAAVRRIVADAGAVREESAIDSIRDRLKTAADQVKQDRAIWKVVKGATSDLSLAILGGVFAGGVQQTPWKIAALAGAARGSASFIGKLYSGIRDARKSARRAELLLRIRDHL
jgi:hypothetical protein